MEAQSGGEVSNTCTGATAAFPVDISDRAATADRGFARYAGLDWFVPV